MYKRAEAVLLYQYCCLLSAKTVPRLSCPNIPPPKNTLGFCYLSPNGEPGTRNSPAGVDRPAWNRGLQAGGGKGKNRKCGVQRLKLTL